MFTNTQKCTCMIYFVLPQTQKLGSQMEETKHKEKLKWKNVWEKQPHKNLNYENKSAWISVYLHKAKAAPNKYLLESIW